MDGKLRQAYASLTTCQSKLVRCIQYINTYCNLRINCLLDQNTMYVAVWRLKCYVLSLCIVRKRTDAGY